MSRTLLRLDRTWQPEDRAAEQVRAIPVAVPSGVSTLLVELSYAAREGAVLDLGLSGPAGYVGWSGGARDHVVVSEWWSTPGYLPTPVEAGRWEVLVGLHRVPPGGLPMTLTVSGADGGEVSRQRSAEPGDPPPGKRPPGRSLPGLDGLMWFAGDFHAHTVHSDGLLSIGGLAALAAGRGLDFLAVTDHNTTSHHPFLAAASSAYGISMLPGQEVTRDIGHANAYGDIGFVDFREPPTTWAAEVDARGGLLSFNHPLSGDCAWLTPLNPPPALAEVWHSSWDLVPTWGAPLAWWTLTPGTTPVGGSDFHRHGADAPPGDPTTWVLAESADPSAILAAVAAGRTAVSRHRDGPILLPMGDELLALESDGLMLTGPARPRRTVRGDRWTHPLAPGPWWLEDDIRVVHALCG